MNIINTKFDGLKIIRLDVYEDRRGYFCETFHADKFKEMGLPCEFVQDNQSYSKKNVIRGLHYQIAPFEQGKLVRVTAGRIIDVAVDIREGSKTFLQHYKCELFAGDHRLLWIPPGFAHGFGVLSEEAVVQYKCTAKYSKEHERGIRWNDPTLRIDWGIAKPLISEKDGVSGSELKIES